MKHFCYQGTEGRCMYSRAHAQHIRWTPSDPLYPCGPHSIIPLLHIGIATQAYGFVVVPGWRIVGRCTTRQPCIECLSLPFPPLFHPFWEHSTNQRSDEMRRLRTGALRIGAQNPLETCAFALSVEGLELFSTCHSSQISKQGFANTFNKAINLIVGHNNILYARRFA